MKIKTRDMILAALFAALTTVGGFISIPIGPIPITLQSFFTLLSGILLGPFLGALSQLVYVIIGLIGIPVFAGGTGGISSIFHPSFGYLLGYIIAPIVVGKIINIDNNPKIVRLLVGSLLGSLAIYVLGIPYMYVILKYVSHVNMTLTKTFQIGCFVFLPGDTLKCIIASIISLRMLPAVKSIGGQA